MHRNHPTSAPSAGGPDIVTPMLSFLADQAPPPEPAHTSVGLYVAIAVAALLVVAAAIALITLLVRRSRGSEPPSGPPVS